MSSRTVALSSKELDSAIEVLSSARHSLQLTRFQKFSYFALIVTADLILYLSAIGICLIILKWRHVYEYSDAVDTAWSLAVLGSILIGLVSLALNVPFILKTVRERARLKQLGLSSLYLSLWKESRRGQWKRWVREIAITVIVIWLASSAVLSIVNSNSGYSIDIIFNEVIASILFGLLVAGRYLRLQRERMDLVASAEELRKALQSLRHREVSGTVSVPSELVEQTAKIESAQIAAERKDAILESVTSRPTGYPIAWDHDAAEQRATLDVADRIELADLVAQLSIAGIKLEAREGTQRKTKGSRVEIDYLIDNASRSIRVIAVRHAREVSPASVDGGSHA